MEITRAFNLSIGLSFRHYGLHVFMYLLNIYAVRKKKFCNRLDKETVLTSN